MAWYCKNSAHPSLAQSDGTAANSYDWWGYSGVTLYVTLYTITGVTRTLRASGSASVADDFDGTKQVTVNIASPITIPDGHYLEVHISPDPGLSSQFFRSAAQTGKVIAAGAHVFNVRCGQESGDELFWVGFGSSQTYGPDAIISTPSSPPVVTTHPSNAQVIEGATATFTAAATGATSQQWQRNTGGGWSDLSGETSTTLDFETVIGENGYQYRCAFTNADGTTYTDAATLSVVDEDSLPAGTYTGAWLTDYFENAGATPVTVAGAVVFTGTLTLDNPDLVLTGASGSLKGPTIYLKRFQSIELDFIESTTFYNEGSGNTTHTICFPADADLSGITDPYLGNTELRGMVLFGSDPRRIPNGGDPRRDTLPNLDGLLIEDCVFTVGAIGAMDGVVTFRRPVLYSQANNYPNGIGTYEYGCFDLGGRGLVFEDVDLATDYCHILLKATAWRGWGKANVGWQVSGALDGAHEEAFGNDIGPLPAFNGHVTGKTANTLTVAVDICPSGAAQLTGTTHQVGRFLVVDEGDAHGDYFEIVAQDGATLTLDTSKYSTTNIGIGDRITVACALVECEWDMSVTWRHGFLDFGQGCNVAASMWGACYGNTVDVHGQLAATRSVPTFHHNTIIPPGTPAASYACLLNDIGWVSPNGCCINSRNVYNDCSSEGAEAFMHAATLFFDSQGEPLVRPSACGIDPIYSQGIEFHRSVADNDAYSEIIDVKDALWDSQDAQSPTTTYSGKTPHDGTLSAAQAPAITYADYYADYYENTYAGRPPGVVFGDDEYPKQDSFEDEPSWLWNYELPLGGESDTTLRQIQAIEASASGYTVVTAELEALLALQSIAEGTSTATSVLATLRELEATAAGTAIATAATELLIAITAASQGSSSATAALTAQESLELTATAESAASATAELELVLERGATSSGESVSDAALELVRAIEAVVESGASVTANPDTPPETFIPLSGSITIDAGPVGDLIITREADGDILIGIDMNGDGQ